MKILNIQIHEFGPIVDRSFDFNDTLTIINGDNESGKSTLMLFIKFALYGLSKRAKAGEASELDKALSHSTKNAAGSMTVSHLGKLYRIDRQIKKSGKTSTERVQLTDLENGTKCNYDGSIGEFLLGFPVEVFESSCGISQLGCSSVKGEQISTAIRNLMTSADESVDSQKAIKILDTVRVKYLHKNKKGGLIYSLSTREEELAKKYTKAVEDRCDTERIENDIKKLDEMITDVSAKQQIADELTSKITLRSVIKLFDKLHEYEDDKKSVAARLDEINEKTSNNGIALDRGFVANLNGTKSELELACKEHLDAEKALKNAPSSSADEQKLLDKVNAHGGLDALKAFFAKATGKVKKFTALCIAFAVLSLLLAAGGIFLGGLVGLSPASVVSFIPATVFVALLVLMLVLRATSKKAVTKKCDELGISAKEIAALISNAEKASVRLTENGDAYRELSAALGIKKRVLASSCEKMTSLFTRYGFSVTDTSPEALTRSATEKASEISSLCDERDMLSGRLSALDSKIREISGELTDYNEHQVRHKVSPEILNMSEDEIRTAKKERDYHALQLKALTDKRRSAENALMERKYSTADPFDIASSLAQTSDALNIHRKNFDAVELAIEALESASANLRNTVAPQIRATANEYMNHITDGKYDSVSVSDTLDLSMSEDGFSYIIDSFSTGTKDAAYLSLRLSLLSLIAEDETPPLLMDETLAMIDDKRASRLLHMLSEHSKTRGQCILFSCHDREERLCKEENIEFSTIKM